MVRGAAELDDREQELAYEARERRRGHIDPGLGLFQTHRFALSDSGFEVGDAFPDRDSPLTVSVTVRRDSSSAQGVMFEAGSEVTGLAIWIPSGGTDVSACAGNSGENGVTLTAKNVLLADGQTVRVTFSVIPGNGEARLWTDGEVRARGAAVSGQLPDGWGGTGTGGVGEVQGGVSSRVPVGDRITLTGATVTTPVVGFVRQRPRQFDDAVVGVPT